MISIKFLKSKFKSSFKIKKQTRLIQRMMRSKMILGQNLKINNNRSNNNLFHKVNKKTETNY